MVIYYALFQDNLCYNGVIFTLII